MDYIKDYRDKDAINRALDSIAKLGEKLPHPLHIMEVCGGHTHTLMKYGLIDLLPNNIEFIHGPGCPVCVIPKSRINQAYYMAMQKDVILLTLGDMIKIPSSHGSLQDARARGADVRFCYSPMEVIRVAKENPNKKIVFFAIGFETTTPMSAALLQCVIHENLKNIFFHINHLLVPPPLKVILHDKDVAINALIAPSHVSVIAGAKIYKEIFETFSLPIVVSGFEPLDMLHSIIAIIKQVLDSNPHIEIQYSRSVSMEGNLKAQELIKKFFCVRDFFEWRGLGEIAQSSMRLLDQYIEFDAEIEFSSILPKEHIQDHKYCICEKILRGRAKPKDCKAFGLACTPTNPIGSCMVSAEGACAAYYKYQKIIQ